MNLKTQKKMDRVKVYRTTEGTVFEVVCALIMFIALIMVCWNASGKELGLMLLTWFILSAVTAFELFMAYHPDSKFVHVGAEVDPKNMKQMALVCRLLRVLGVCVALMSLVILLGMIWEGEKLIPIFTKGIFVLLLGVIIFFSILIRQAGRKGKK